MVTVSMIRAGRQLVAAAVAALAAISCMGPGHAKTQPAAETPVLLSLDVEREGDFARMRAFNLGVPATYFLLGDLTEQHKAEARALVDGRNTVGSHSYSHANLAKLDRAALADELRRAYVSFEDTFGVAPRWFRAPFLAVNDDVFAAIKEAGFTLDSSLTTQMTGEVGLPYLPITMFEGHTASDFEMFDVSKMSTDEAFEWLMRAYRQHKEAGRPFNILLHPAIIEPHIEALKRFITAASADGARFLSYDQYMLEIQKRAPRRIAAWADPAEVSAERIVEDAKRIGATDVFLRARTIAGEELFRREGAGEDRFGRAVAALRRENVTVHAWLPALRNPRLAAQHPEWAMRTFPGRQTSTEWLSPSSAAARADLLATVELLAQRYDIQGVHLDELRYPDSRHDFHPETLAAFARTLGQPSLTNPDAWRAARAADGAPVWGRWNDYRAVAITALAQAVRDRLNRAGRSSLTLSAALVAEAAARPLVEAEAGQDYAALAGPLDLIVPKAGAPSAASPSVEEIALQTRFRVGETAVYLGLTPDGLAGTLDAAKRATDGIAFYPLRAAAEAADTIRAGALTPSEAVWVDQVAPAQMPGVGLIWGRLVGENFTPLAGIGFMAMSIGTAFGLLNLIDWRRRRRVAAVAAGANDNSAPDPTSALGVERLNQLDEACAAGEIDGATFHQIHKLAAAEDISLRDRRRIAYVLTRIGAGRRPIAALIEDLGALPGWGPLARPLLEEATLLGFVTLTEQDAALTAEGHEEAARAARVGLTAPATHAFLEARACEHLLVQCPSCQRANATDWGRVKLKCRACNKPYEIKPETRVRVRAQTLTSPLRKFA